MKVKYNLSLDENLKNKFNEFCKENGLTASSVISMLIVEFLKKNNKEL
ncbi:MAG: hypothetical protein KH846_10485 [Leptotrichia wadei]|nr:hypothetical protein [Leptotrichia wadei]MBS6020587.1 hypothetical protein [Leptotrichia wadei]